MYWVASSSKTNDEKEEKWKSITNHVVNVHVHKGNKIFTKCTHGVLARVHFTQKVRRSYARVLTKSHQASSNVTPTARYVSCSLVLVVE